MKRSIRSILSVITLSAVMLGMAACADKKINEPNETNVTVSVPAGYESARGGEQEIPDRGTVGGYEYGVMETGTDGQGIRKNRGFYVDTLDEPDAPYFIFVCSGEKSSGGYEIRISDVWVDSQGEITVVVEETSPAGDAATAVMTAPYCGLQLVQCPESVKVIDIYGNSFSDISGL
ncbi:MAG: protease complex subunit PrcB family protein [Clostridiales bacterium]|nr:protease complex subunit PrcB family protein [Clostridiales bacterium]